MSRYKKKVICPLDGVKLSWPELVETRASDIYTYHCGECGTYWHVEWFKHVRAGSDAKNWNWNYKSIYDDFGKRFELKEVYEVQQ